MDSDPFDEGPTTHYYDGARFGTAPEMIAELSDLRASNARMADVFSSIRDRLGLDDGGSILDALDALLPHKSEETFAGRLFSLLPGSIVEVDDSTGKGFRPVNDVLT